MLSPTYYTVDQIIWNTTANRRQFFQHVLSPIASAVAAWRHISIAMLRHRFILNLNHPYCSPTSGLSYILYLAAERAYNRRGHGLVGHLHFPTTRSNAKLAFARPPGTSRRLFGDSVHFYTIARLFPLRTDNPARRALHGGVPVLVCSRGRPVVVVTREHICPCTR